MKSFEKFLLLFFVFLCFQGFIYATKTLEQIAKENKTNSKSKKQNSYYIPSSSYEFEEKVLGILPPFKDVEFKQAELTKASQKSIEFFETAAEIEKDPNNINNPAKAIRAWANLKQIRSQNPFLPIANKRFSEWNKAAEKLKTHQESFSKVYKIATSSGISKNQKKAIIIKHLKDFGAYFGVQEILNILTSEKDDTTTKDPDFIKTVKSIRLKRCDWYSGKDCYEFGILENNQDKKTLFLQKSCDLKYTQGCDKIKAVEAEKTDDNKLIEKTTFNDLQEKVIGVIPPFQEPRIETDELMEINQACLKSFEKAVKAEKDPDIIQEPREVIKAWGNVKQSKSPNPFTEIAENRLNYWTNAFRKLYAHQQSFQKLKMLVTSEAIATEQKKNVMLSHLNEFGISFGVSEILTIAKKTKDKDLKKAITESDFQSAIKSVRLKRCDLDSGKDCLEYAMLLKDSNGQLAFTFIEKACSLNYKPACDKKALFENKNEEKVDVATGLEWSSKSPSKMTFEEAVHYCNELSDEGYEWRMPTISELRTLIQNSKNTASDGLCGVTNECLSANCWSKKLCTNNSSDSKNSHSKLGDTNDLWSNSRSDSKCWYIDFNYGNIDKTYCNYGKYVRCIKSGNNYFFTKEK